jgi:hypothetical protein
VSNASAVLLTLRLFCFGSQIKPETEPYPIKRGVTLPDYLKSKVLPTAGGNQFTSTIAESTKRNGLKLLRLRASFNMNTDLGT